jgi:GT2 family glycosyltransferase/predicted  nucleic acid-binding Zn-ribbon protein
VLDVGCAKGFLVEALRDRGVEAFGIDISEYAIGEVRPDLEPHCRVASAVEPFDEHYDLITCIEVLEHLGEEDGRTAIANICRSADDVLLSSTPDDVTEPTHVNVRPCSWWIERFAEHGFRLDTDFDAGFIAAHAMRFRAGPAAGSPLDPLLAQRHGLLRQLAALHIDNAALGARRDRLESDLAALGTLRDALQAEVVTLRDTNVALGARRDRLESDLAAVQRGADALRHELTARRLEVTALRQEGDQLRQAIEARDGLIARLGTLRDALQAEVAGLRDTVETKDELIAGLQTLRDGLQAEVAGLQRSGGEKDELIAGLQTLRDGLQAEVAGLQRSGGEKDELIAGLQTLRDGLQAEVAGLQRSGGEKDELIAGLNYHLLAVQRTIGWKVLERLRRVRDWLLPPDTRRWVAYCQIRRPVEVLLDEGLRAFVWKTTYKFRLKWRGQEFLVKVPPREVASETSEWQYERWLQRHRLTPQAARRMTAALKAFVYTPLISVVTPVYDTDEIWLRKVIESVRAQIYPHWELCLVNDGSTKPHVREILDQYAAAEPRVRVAHLPRNEGIAGASTHGLRLATGDFVALLDHDDELPPEALFEVARRLNEEPDLDLIYSDEDKLEMDGRRVEPTFKPDWSPDLLLSMNYITHLVVFRRSLLGEIGGFRLGFDGSQDYDLLLRFTERTQRIAHIPKILYHWRKIRGSAAASPAAKPFAYEAARRAIEEAVRRRGYEGLVKNTRPGQYTVRYRLRRTPLVSIIIPTRDRWTLLRECLRSIEEKTTYTHYEILVVNNDSSEPETARGLEGAGHKWRVLDYPGPFNFSAINNLGAAHAKGDVLVFLNNDTQVIEPDWLTAMLEQAQRPEVGAVGARLHYPDGRIQHAGVMLGVGGVADHAFKGLPGDAFTYFALGSVVRNCSAVTAACMMMPRRAFEEVKGFDERLAVALNDVDLCLRLRQRGYLIVYTPFALLYHHESGTRGRLFPPQEEELVWALWGDAIRRGDPYYNPNLTLSRTDWSLGD